MVKRWLFTLSWMGNGMETVNIDSKNNVRRCSARLPTMIMINSALENFGKQTVLYCCA